MSMENAILELAAAMREQAAAIRESNEVSRGTAQGYEKAVTAYATASGQAAKENTDKGSAGPDAELEKAVEKVEADAAADKKAKQKALDDTAAEKPAEKIEDTTGEPLDYVKDVRPLLLAAIKKSGKEKVAELVATFGADKADKIDPSKYAELLAGAQKLAA